MRHETWVLKMHIYTCTFFIILLLKNRISLLSNMHKILTANCKNHPFGLAKCALVTPIDVHRPVQNFARETSGEVCATHDHVNIHTTLFQEEPAQFLIRSGCGLDF